MKSYSFFLSIALSGGIASNVEGTNLSAKHLRRAVVEQTTKYDGNETSDDEDYADWWINHVVMSISPIAPTSAPTEAPVVAPTSAPMADLFPTTVSPVTEVSASPTAAQVMPIGLSPASVAPTSTQGGPASSAPVDLIVAPPTAPTTGTLGVALRLYPFLIHGGAEFMNPNSYQSKALRRVEEQDGIDFVTDAKLVQLYALFCIFAATNSMPNSIIDSDPSFNGNEIPGWINKWGWTENDIDPCTGWYGVVCVDNRVTGLLLFNNDLSGVWPHEVTLLASDGPRGTSGAGALAELDIFSNQFLFNDYDNSWMSLLGSAMEKLYFSSTSFSGRLAPLPVNLVEFDCSYTMIDGGLTNEVFKGLNNLNFVLLDGNAFNSSVPSVFGSLPNLEYLYISDAFISGDLSYMQGMPKMVEHWVDVNPGLKGTIPTFIGKITSLKSLSMSQGSLTGTLPTELGNLSNMIQMWFFANSLEGQIPSEIGSLTTLRTFQTEGNNIGGLVPPEICALRESSLQILGSDCTLTGCTCCSCCDLESCSTNFVV